MRTHATEARLQDFAQFPADYIHESRSGEWLPGLTGKTASAIAANPRLRAKVSWLITKAYKLSEGSAVLDEANAVGVTASFETLERAATLAGASFHAPLIRRIVDRETLSEIFGVGGHGDYLFVISQGYDLRATGAAQTTGVQGLALAVKEDGFACLDAWISGSELENWSMTEHNTLRLADDAQPGDLDDITVKLAFEMGRRDVSLGELKTIAPGYIFDLSRTPENAIEIYAGSQRIGQGEIVQIGDALGVRVTRLFNNE